MTRFASLFTLLGLFLTLTVGCNMSIAPTPPLTIVAIDTPLPTDTVAAVTLPASTPTATIVSVASATATQPAVIQEPAPAGEPTRIIFEPGMAGTIVRGEVEAGATHRYVLSARADQSMFVSLASPAGDAVLAVEGSNGQIYLNATERQTQWSSVALPATQDYIVSVVSIGNRTNYTLDVGISALSSLPTRIQFAPGATSATISGTLAAGGAADYYILGAAAGQHITIETVTTAAPLFVWLEGEDGASFFAADDSGRLLAQLPLAQDYILTVAIPNAAGQTDYSLTVTIE